MKILNVDILLDPIRGGGTAERTFQMSRFLARDGQNCTVLTLDVGLTRERINAMVGVKVVALPCWLKRFGLPRFSLAAINQIVGDSDIIHLMSHWTFLNALVYCCARCQKKPYVVCPAGALPIFGRSRVIKKIYNLLIGKNIIRNASRCIAIAQNEFAHFKNYGVQPEAIAVIPNGVCPEDYLVKEDAAFRRAHGIPDAPFILFVGRLNPIKGPDILLRAFCALKDKIPHHLVLAGPDGGILSDLEEIVKRENAGSRVHFVGYLGGAQKSLAYHAADLLVIPSRSEAMSIVVLEAGAAATPVLITDQCGFNDIADIGGGRVVSASEEGISEGLRNILSHPNELTMMGSRLQQYVQQSFTWDSIVKKYLSIYRELLGIP
ncbi:MAG: glycosyltransferase [Kiritimatiellae bacterium]|nr:glycosyltransferase [Kiritimatiellia bacterium]